MNKPTNLSAVSAANALRRLADEIQDHGGRIDLFLELDFPDCDPDCAEALAQKFAEYR